MKLWKKNYIIFFICFIISFNLAGIIIIERIFNQGINREIKDSLSEHKTIVSGLHTSIHMYNNMEKINGNKSIKLFIGEYIDVFKKEADYIEILDMGENEIFSNLDFNIPQDRPELESLLKYRRNYIIRVVDNEYYLFVAGLMNLNKDYKLSYVRDISYIYKERKEQYHFFFLFELYICMGVSVLIYILSKILTRPITSLINTTKKIANGNYYERVKISSKDELGILSENFNQMADAIEEKINELERNGAEKQRFIENLTHELKTPLTSIIGYADLLRTTKVDDKILKESIDFIYKEGKRLEQLSFKMMDLIVVEVDDFQLRPERIINVFEEVRGILQPKLDGKNIKLVISGDNDEVYLEKDMMKLLLTNLIDNSIKASNENSHIYLNFYKENNHKIIEVRDEGIGISKEKVEYILEPFYVVDKSRTRANNGIGLGLAICERIAEIHHGRLEIESKLNKGTRVRIIF